MSKSDSWQFIQSFLNFIKQLLVAHWRSLLLLLLGVYLPLQVFEQLAMEIWKHQGGFPWDEPILLAIHATSQTQLDVFAQILTKFAAPSNVLTVSVAIALVLFLQRRWRSLTYLLTSIIGSTIINRTAKILLHRARPELWVSPSPELDYAFPSGHAMLSMTLVAALVILTWGSPWRRPILAVGSLYVVAIGWTRLYLGVHFPSDILAGWMVSLAWVIGVSLLIRPHLTLRVGNNDVPLDETTLLLQETQLLNED